MRIRRGISVGISLFLLTSFAIQQPAATAASCAVQPPLAQVVAGADVLFVGTVTSTTNRNRWAEVAVEEVWRGPDLPATVVVRGGPDGDVATSVDRSYRVGARYLFLPYADPESGGLADNSCTGTTEWVDELAGLRPAEVRQPRGSSPDTSSDLDAWSLVPVAGIVLLVFGVLLVVGLVARDRQEG